MVTMSDYQQQFHELRFKDRLSVADAVVLEHRLGLTKAANFVAEVDPWCYPHDDSTPATIGFKTSCRECCCKGGTYDANFIKLHGC